jgi:hypothetical protein
MRMKPASRLPLGSAEAMVTTPKMERSVESFMVVEVVVFRLGVFVLVES